MTTPSHTDNYVETWPIRTANRAIIIAENRLLVCACESEGGIWYQLPGGGQEFGEDRRSSLRRECLEELGCDVVVGEAIAARDYVGANHDFAERDSWFHQSEVWFACELADGQSPQRTSTGDAWQVGWGWLDLDDIADAPLWPKVLRSWLVADPDHRDFYLGDVN